MIKILAIDDNQDNLTSLKAILRETLPEAKVILASSGRKGLALAMVEEPDMILLDIVMPGLDGFEVCREIKGHERLNIIPVVFLTAARTDRESQIRALEVGAEAFLPKPLDERELTSVVLTMAKIKEANELRQKERERLASLVHERTGALRQESDKRTFVEEKLNETNLKLRKNQAALMNMLEDLKAENLARKKSEEELSISEERFRSLYDNSTVGLYRTTPGGKILMANPAALKMLGYDSLADLQQRDLNREGYEPDHPREKFVRTVESDGFVLGWESAWTKRSGEVLNVRESAVAVRDEKGNTIYYDGTFEDITLRKMAEQRYQVLFTSMAEGFALHEIVVDKKGKPVNYCFLEVNPAFEEFTGMRAVDLVGKTLLETIPGIEPVWIDTYNDVAKTGKPLAFTLYAKKFDKWFRVSVFSPGKGKLAAIFSDVSELIRMENALRESESKFRGITEQITDMIFMTDEKGFLEYISPAAFQIFGYRPEEMVGHHFMMFLGKKQAPAANKKFRSAIKHGIVEKDLVLTMQRKDGSTFQGELQSAPFVLEEKTIGALGLIRDISDRLKAEKELKDYAKKLKDLTTHIEEMREEERREIAQNLHDDLGQKLTALNIDLSWLARNIPVDLPELAGKITSMHELLLETVSRVKRISTELRPSILDDLGVTAAIIWLANDFSERTGISCKVSIIPEDLTMPDDRGTQLFRIVQEALTNIMRHAAASGVMISLIRKEYNWRLRIKDNGKGFSEEDLENKQSFGITGMEERARICGGAFSISGTKGKGTEIVVEIPISE